MTSDERDDGVGVDTETEPRHAEGLCDLGACENLANWAYEDSEGDVYVEVCEEHAGSLESQFDSDYERVDHDSPYRELSERRGHGCGGDLLVYEIEIEGAEEPEGEAGNEAEYRVCEGCSYAMLVENTGEGRMRVRHTDVE